MVVIAVQGACLYGSLKAWHGLARSGMAGHGVAGHGPARQGRDSFPDEVFSGTLSFS